MAKSHETSGRQTNPAKNIEGQPTSPRESIEQTARLYRLLDKARQGILSGSRDYVNGIWAQSEREQLLAHPELSPEMVGLVIDWACQHFEQNRAELEEILERGQWNEIEKIYVFNGYDHPQGGQPNRSHHTPWLNWCERAEGVFQLLYPEDRQTFLNLYHSNPASADDREKGCRIVRRRGFEFSWLIQVIRSKPDIALEPQNSQRIRASNDPTAIEILDKYESAKAERAA